MNFTHIQDLVQDCENLRERCRSLRNYCSYLNDYSPFHGPLVTDAEEPVDPPHPPELQAR